MDYGLRRGRGAQPKIGNVEKLKVEIGAPRGARGLQGKGKRYQLLVIRYREGGRHHAPRTKLQHPVKLQAPQGQVLTRICHLGGELDETRR